MSPEHYTKNTVEASIWCNKCGKHTMHRVDSGRRGPCKVCMANLEPAAPKKAAATQTTLF